jgi:PAS domain S-box-containing protein
MKILIAEDDFTSRTVLTAVLKKQGHEVATTVNGAEAWATMQQPDAPKLAILDWMMPEMDGIEVCRQIRTLETDQPPYIIMLTSKDEKADIIAGLGAGADDYLAKPYDPGELHARVNVGQRMIEMQTKLISRTRELRESEGKYRFLVENSHDIIYTLTVDGVFTFASPSWTMLLGHPLAQVTGRPFQQFVHPDDLQDCTVFLKAVIDTGQRQEGIEYRVQHEDGSWLWHTSNAVPIRDKDGMIIGLEGTARDITEHKRLEEEQRNREKLENALEMAGTICHEMNQPIQVISGYVDLLSMDTPEDSEIGKKLSTIKGQIHRIGTVSRKLMSLKFYVTQDYVGIGNIIDIDKTTE